MDIISFEGSNATRGGDDRKPGTGSQIKYLVTRNQYNGPNTGELLSAEMLTVEKNIIVLVNNSLKSGEYHTVRTEK